MIDWPIPQDLLFYLLYTLQDRFFDEYGLTRDQVADSPYLRSIYIFYLMEGLKKELESHQLTYPGIESLDRELLALDDYLLEKDEMELAKYYDYLESWTMANRSWLSAPIPFDGFEFI